MNVPVRAYFHKGTGEDGDTDTWFIPVNGPGFYTVYRATVHTITTEDVLQLIEETAADVSLSLDQLRRWIEGSDESERSPSSPHNTG